MKRSWWSRAGRWLAGLALPVLLLALAWRHADPGAGLRLIAQAGPLAALGLVPFALTLTLDALGWRTLFAPRSRPRVRLGQAFAARLSGEAVSQSLPSAGLAGEAASAWLLFRLSGVPLGEAIGSLAARRILVAVGHALVLGFAAIASAADPRVPRPLLVVAGLAAAGLLLAAAFASRLVRRTSPFARLHVALRRSPWGRLRSWAAGGSVRLRDADREATRTLGGPWQRQAAAVALFAGVYLAEALETFVLLALLGAPLTPWQVLAFEPLVSLLRALAFFVPAGLGVQDLGYVALLNLVGVPHAAAVGAAFVVLKRLKELVWAVGGWSVLLAAEAAAPAPADAAGRKATGEHGEKPDPLHLRFHQSDDADAPDRPRVARA